MQNAEPPIFSPIESQMALQVLESAENADFASTDYQNFIKSVIADHINQNNNGSQLQLNNDSIKIKN